MMTFSLPAMPPSPFHPQISPCEKLREQLATWILQGVVSSPSGSTALMGNAHGARRRFKVQSELLPGVHVENIGLGFVTVTLSSGCQITSYRWKIKGKVYAMDSGITSGVASALH